MQNANEPIPMFADRMTLEEWRMHEEWIERRMGRDVDAVNRLRNRMYFFYFLLADGRKS